MKKQKLTLQITLTLLLCFVANLAWAFFPDDMDFERFWRENPFYVGLAGGFGSTDWSQLTAHCGNLDPSLCLLALSAPLSAGDQGFVWGVFIGYEIQPHFAFEINYVRFPDTTIVFDEFSLYATEDGVITMKSGTYAYSFLGKFMVHIGSTGLRGFATAGAAMVHRTDSLANDTHVNPTFGVGINYVFPFRMMMEIGFQYYAGYGQAVLKPAINYIPFLYDVHLKLGYQF